MMKKIEDLNFYELLEVSPSATPQEIHKAYERVRRIYEPNSIALYSLFTAEETVVIQQRIEEAYRTLIYEDNRRQYDATLRNQREIPEPEALYLSRPCPPPAPTSRQTVLPLADEDRIPVPRAPVQQAPEPKECPPPEEVKPVSEFIGEFTGPAIKALREQCGRSLKAIADITKVSTRYLEYIEEENFRKLPARTYIRGFLILYAKALGCDADRLASDYMKRYDAAMKPAKK